LSSWFWHLCIMIESHTICYHSWESGEWRIFLQNIHWHCYVIVLICTFDILLSGTPAIVHSLLSVLGQWLLPKQSHCGPDHHRLLFSSWSPPTPLESRSAGFCADETWCHCSIGAVACILLTLLATNTVQLLGALDIQHNTIMDSVQYLYQHVFFWLVLYPA
jgi:TRAP-type mannitol/chloroaromatic compound transport system permease small subunit